LLRFNNYYPKFKLNLIEKNHDSNRRTTA
jgi:hypothetical protein